MRMPMDKRRSSPRGASACRCAFRVADRRASADFRISVSFASNAGQHRRPRAASGLNA